MEQEKNKSRDQAEAINGFIANSNANTDYISDGFHSFGELYEHRITLYITLCKVLRFQQDVWKSRKHSDGSYLDDWFILGIGKEFGKQITYHLPMCKWGLCEFAEILTNAPDYDDHCSTDVLDRLLAI